MSDEQKMPDLVEIIKKVAHESHRPIHPDVYEIARAAQRTAKLEVYQQLIGTGPVADLLYVMREMSEELAGCLNRIQSIERQWRGVLSALNGERDFDERVSIYDRDPQKVAPTMAPQPIELPDA